MKRVIFLLLLLVFFIGCSTKQVPIAHNSYFDDSTERAYVTYESGVLNYYIAIEKPAPCYKIVKDEKVMESYPVQVVVDIHLEPPEDFCVEIISEETVTGRIVTGHKPRSFKVTFEGGDFYYTNFK